MYLWLIAAFTAYFVKGICGFANTLIFTSILSFGTSNAQISPVDLLLGFPANLILIWKNRRNLDPRVFLPLSAFVLAGSIPGALLLRNADTRIIKLIFGIVIVALGAETLSRAFSKGVLRSSRPVLVIIGITSGVMCGMFGVGALLAAYMSRVTDTGSSFKANLSAVYIADNIFRIILYSILGLLTPVTVKTALLLFPFALLGLFAGIRWSAHVNDRKIQIITSVLLELSGISLILMNL